MKLKNLVFLFVLLLFSQLLSATHIVGGEMSYECLGNDEYRITMRVYRDCWGGGANLDNPAPISIYTGFSGTTLAMPPLSVNLSGASNIPPVLDNPCLIPPSNVCVQEGIYTFNVILPFNANGYHLTYERCCRNGTISNIFQPGDVGATYTIFISSEAQTSCNNSPVFNDFPPIIICGGEELNFDHSATDQEGDSLVYSFCAPFVGGSTTNPSPQQPAAPPYQEVNFIGGYTELNPMGGNPIVTIDPVTGLITGIPSILGQFVVGVCVQEYRNGVLISETKRDFQFNVTNCTQTIFANILEDELINPNLYVMHSCGENTINFVNQSSQQAFINDYFWAFDLNGMLDTSILTNPSFTFPGIGQYQGILVVNRGNLTCTDTAEIIVNVYPEINAGFEIVFDTCTLDPVSFIDTSFSGSGLITNWNWDFDDSNTSTIQNPIHTYLNPNSYDVTLEVIDSNNCADQISQILDWFPTSVIDIIYADSTGCEPHTVNFTNLSAPFTGAYDILWEFSDLTSSTDENPVHTFVNDGLYSVTVTVTSPTNCQSTAVYTDIINVVQAPNVDFSFVYDSCAIDVVSFFEQTSPGDSPLVSWFWEFGDDSTSTALNPMHQYLDAGSYSVSLTVIDQKGCPTTYTQIVDWFPAPIIDVIVADQRGCAPFNVFFDNNSYPINGYLTEWDFGDGNTSTLASPTHDYQYSGVYTVILTITSPTNCIESDTFTNLITVDSVPIAQFQFGADSCIVGPVSFIDQSIPGIDPIVSWDWDFGDGGGTSNQQSPQHLFPMSGTFDVSLVVLDQNGCTDSITQSITWAPAPTITVVPDLPNGCTDHTVFFQNNSFPLNGYATNWTFGDGAVSTVESPTHTYTSAGIYTISLEMISPSGCVSRDTFINMITVDTIPTAIISYNFDDCVDGITNFIDSSLSNGGTIIGWDWDFGDGNTSIDQHPAHAYTAQGTYDIQLTVTDDNGCTDQTVITIDWYPPSILDIEVDDYFGCTEHTVNFTNNSLPVIGYDILWDLGDGTTSTELNPTHTYTATGEYSVSLSITTPTGCISQETWVDYIRVTDPPVADFSFSPDKASNFEPEVEFTDLSENASQWYWDFDDNGEYSTQQNPTYTFQDTGFHAVTLLVTQLSGCQDSITKIVDVEPLFTYFLPNAFTPNYDDVNDFFKGKGITETLSNFEMNIWNRWGELVFTTNDPNQSWNGKKNNTGKMCKNGVYVVNVALVGGRGEQQEMKGFATLIR